MKKTPTFQWAFLAFPVRLRRGLLAGGGVGLEAHPDEAEDGEDQIRDAVLHVMGAVDAERGQEARHAGEAQNGKQQKNDSEDHCECFQEMTPFKASSKQIAPKTKQYQPNGRRSLCLK